MIGSSISVSRLHSRSSDLVDVADAVLSRHRARSRKSRGADRLVGDFQVLELQLPYRFLSVVADSSCAPFVLSHQQSRRFLLRQQLQVAMIVAALWRSSQCTQQQ